MDNAKQENTRDQAKRVSKRFKTSWVDIGEFLTKIASEKLYEEWGYKRFEDYCKVELKLKKATAMKLTNAYFFLENEPALKEKDLDIDVVLSLQKVKNNDKCDNETYQEFIELAVKKDRAASTIDQKLNSLEVKPGDKMSDFHMTNKTMTSRLLGRIKPIGDVPEKYKVDLGEMLKYFETESKVED